MKHLTLAVLILSVFCPYAQADMLQNRAQGALLAFKEAREASLIRKLRSLPKGAIIKLYCARGKVIEGRWAGYKGYDRSVWIVALGDMLSSAYDISEVMDARVVILRQV